MIDAIHSLYDYLRLGRPYYVLPVVATAFAGCWSATHVLPLFYRGTLAGLVFLLLGWASWSVNEITDRLSDAQGTTKMKWGLYISGGTMLFSSGRVSVKSTVVLIIGSSVFGLLIAGLLGWQFWCLSFFFLSIGLAYSIRPVRLKEKGMLGLFAVALAYGFVAFTAGWTASGELPTPECLWFGSFLTLSYFGFEGLAQLLDFGQDLRNSENTIAVSLGPNVTRGLLSVCQIMPVSALAILSQIAGASLPQLNTMILIPVLFFSAVLASLTASCQKLSLLSTLRLLSIPLMAFTAFLIV